MSLRKTIAFADIKDAKSSPIHAFDAKKVWTTFHAKIASAVAKLVPDDNKKPDPKPWQAPAEAKFSPKELAEREKAAKIIQKRWKRFQQSEFAIPFKAGKRHPKLLRYFLNGNTIYRSKQSRFHGELLMKSTQPDWTFHTEISPLLLPLVGMDLYIAEKISPQQLFTILDYVSIRGKFNVDRHNQTIEHIPQFELTHLYRVLDENEFSADFENILSTLIDNPARKFRTALTEEQRKHLRLLLNELPPSELYFYKTDLGRYHFARYAVPNKHYFVHDLIAIESIGINLKEKYIVNVSESVMHALNLVIFGDNYVPTIPRLGKQTKNDIEAAVRQGIRIAAQDYMGVEWVDRVHRYEDVNHLEARAHDRAHSLLLSSIPPYIRNASFRMVDILRKNIPANCYWTKETWVWSDFESSYFAWQNPRISEVEEAKKIQVTQNADAKTTTATAPLTLFARPQQYKTTLDFCQYFLYGFSIYEDHFPNDKSKAQGGYLFPNGQLSFAGALVLIDMIENENAWRDLSINPNCLIEPFKSHYEKIKLEHYFSEKTDPRLKVLEIFCKLHLNTPNDFKKVMGFITSHPQAFLAELEFNALQKSNLLVLTYKNRVVTTEVIAEIHRNILNASEELCAENQAMRRLAI